MSRHPSASQIHNQSRRQTQGQSVLSWLIPRLYRGTVRAAVADLRKRAVRPAHGRELSVVFTPNPEQVELAQRSPEFAQLLRAADVLLPDGEGLVWAARRQGVALARVTGREVVQQWLDQPIKDLPRTLLLGGQGSAAEDLARLVDPTGYRVRGLAGYKRVTKPTDSEQAAVEAMILRWKPQVVLVGFGAPSQEAWIIEHKEMLQLSGVRVAMAVGGTFDVLSGQLSAPPDWIVGLKGEWLFRLWQQPSRWRRQVWLVRFVWRVLVG